MVQAVHSVNSFIFPNMLALRGIQERLRVPVRPIHAIYASFKHIKGVPSPQGGVPVLKLRILDNLIDKLLSYRESVPHTVDAGQLSPQRIEGLIQKLQVTLKQRVMESAPMFGGLFPETGMLIDMVA
jgi:hypothetical protein